MKRPAQLQYQAYNYIIDLIKTGRLEENTIYSLNQMAQRIGISRTPLRDAVHRLEEEGYIDIYPSKGFSLHNLTEDEIIETYQMRNALETYCFKQLANSLQEERAQACLKELSSGIDDQIELLHEPDSRGFAYKDYSFHCTVVKFVNNESMLEIYEKFMYRIFMLNVKSFSVQGRTKQTVREHRTIIEMVEKGKMEELETIIQHHLETARKICLSLCK